MATLCDIIGGGRTRRCKDSIGGTSKVYIFNYLADPFTVVNCEATAINPLLTEVYEYELVGDGNSLAQVKTGDRTTGTSGTVQTLTVNFQRMTAEDNCFFNKWAAGYPQAVVKDKNGLYHVVGITEGIDFTISPTTGGAITEFNGYAVVGVANELDLAPILDEATVALFLDLVVPTPVPVIP